MKKSIFYQIAMPGQKNTFQYSLGKPRKKVLLIMAGPLRAGGGEVPAIKEKKIFWNFLKYFVAI